MESCTSVFKTSFEEGKTKEEALSNVYESARCILETHAEMSDLRISEVAHGKTKS